MRHKPSKEKLQEEYISKLISNPSLMNQVLVGCDLSWKYKIDIRRFMWNVGGIKRNSYEKVLPLLSENNVKFYMESSET